MGIISGSSGGVGYAFSMSLLARYKSIWSSPAASLLLAI
jgi:hypothetical protein